MLPKLELRRNRLEWKRKAMDEIERQPTPTTKARQRNDQSSAAEAIGDARHSKRECTAAVVLES